MLFAMVDGMAGLSREQKKLKRAFKNKQLAHVCIDLQKSYANFIGQKVFDNADALAVFLRTVSVLNIWVIHNIGKGEIAADLMVDYSHTDLYEARGDVENDLSQHIVKRVDGEPVYLKRGFDSFRPLGGAPHKKNFDNSLGRGLDIAHKKAIIVSGCMAERCVKESIRSALDLGYSVYLDVDSIDIYALNGFEAKAKAEKIYAYFLKEYGSRRLIFMTQEEIKEALTVVKEARQDKWSASVARRRPSPTQRV